MTGARDRVAKKAYIRAIGYANPPFDAAPTKLKATAGWRVYEVPCGHDVMVDMPDRLTEIPAGSGIARARSAGVELASWSFRGADAAKFMQSA